MGSASDRPLGLFGGRFDPVHRAHIAVAQAVANALNLDEVRWIVTGEPQHKSVIAPPDDRLQMIKLALRELGDPRMVADDREIIAARSGGSNYTADTVLTIQQEFPNRSLIWILGEDQLQHFTRWSRWQWLICQVSLAVCARPGAEGSRAAKALMESGGKIHWVSIEADNISSTEIRRLLHKGLLAPGMIPETVKDYIRRTNLY